MRSLSFRVCGYKNLLKYVSLFIFKHYPLFVHKRKWIDNTVKKKKEIFCLLFP